MYDAKVKWGEKTFANYMALPKTQRQDASGIVQVMVDGIKNLEPSQSTRIIFVLFRL